MKITLNLATRPYADQGPALKRLRIGMLVLVVLLLAMGFALLQIHQSALRMAAEEETADRAIANIESQEQGYQAEMRKPDNARVLKQAEFLNKLFEEKSFSWTAAMEDLERVLPAGVQVTAIEPSRGKDGRITLHLRISGQRERSVEMLRNMERSRRFQSPRISGENAENTSQAGGLQPVIDTGNGKVSFDVLSEYSPATLEERKAAIAAMKRGRGGAAQGSAVSPKVLESPRQAPRMPQMPARQPFYPGMQPGMPGRPGMPGPYRPQGPQGQTMGPPQGQPQGPGDEQ
jgi:type IV pilus assembly protein PilN